MYPFYHFCLGDARNSEQPGLAAVHTLFVREHNQIADYLSQINPHWSDQELYDQTRRIMGGLMQHITYNEFLPRILGWNAINLYELNLVPEGYYHGKAFIHLPVLKNMLTISKEFGISISLH